MMPRLFIGLITSHPKLFDSFVARRAGLAVRDFPEILANSSLKTAAFNPNDRANRCSLDEFVWHHAQQHDALLLLVEEQHLAFLEGMRNALFIVSFDVPYDLNNIQNFIGRKLARPMRSFAFLMGELTDGGNLQPAILPTQNFMAPELTELCRVCQDEYEQGDFADQVGACLGALNARKQPRRQTSSNRKYFIDDDKKYFEYGHELHAILDTGSPHNRVCEINGHFRFGRRFDFRRHFNVSYGTGDNTYISGKFPNCHGETIDVSPERTHLNMFSNDFF